MRLFQELKRRNVFRVGIAYAVVAWLVMQFADVVLNNITAPGWVFQAIMLLLAIGFPIVLVFAWAFEGDWPDDRLPVCNEITMEYPKGSGKTWTFPEIDRVELLPLCDAKKKLSKQQAELLDRLVKRT